jgi:hypothetical protein
MRTSFDLDDDLFRQLKATAALRGVSMRELITRAILRELSANPTGEKAAPLPEPPTSDAPPATPRPWLGALSEYADRPGISHDLDDIRASVADARRRGAR